MKNNSWAKFYECHCGCDGITISSDDFIEEENMKGLDMCFWQLGSDGQQLCFKERVRWAWHLLIKGKLFTDMVTINKQTAKELGQDLLDWGNK